MGEGWAGRAVGYGRIGGTKLSKAFNSSPTHVHLP